MSKVLINVSAYTGLPRQLHLLRKDLMQFIWPTLGKKVLSLSPDGNSRITQLILYLGAGQSARLWGYLDGETLRLEVYSKFRNNSVGMPPEVRQLIEARRERTIQ